MTQEYNCYANTLLKKKKIGESIYRVKAISD